MITRRRLGLTIGALLVPASAAFAQAVPEAIKSRGAIRVAIEFGRPPWAFKDDKLEMNGSDVDTAQLLADDMGVRLQVVDVTGPNRVSFLVTGKADLVISTFSITPEREKVVDFSRPYASALQYVAAPQDLQIASLSDLVGKRVGVTRGTTGDTAITAAAAKVPGIDIVRFDDESTNMTAFASGQVPTVVQEPATIKAIAERNPARHFEAKFLLAQFPVGIGIKKNQPELKAWVDNWVTANMENGKLNAIYRKYNGVDLPAEIRSPGH